MTWERQFIAARERLESMREGSVREDALRVAEANAVCRAIRAAVREWHFDEADAGCI